MLHQCRQLQQNVPPNINLKVTPLEKPGKGKLVYLGTIASRIKLLKMFSVSTSVAACILMPGLVGDLSQMNALEKIALGTALGFFIFMSPALVHLFAKRYVTSIYYDEDTNKFTASTYNFLAREVEHVFTPEKVEHFSHGLLSSVKVNNVPLAIDSSLFFDRSLYSKMMGFDKEEWQLPEHYSENRQTIGQEKEKSKTSS